MSLAEYGALSQISEAPGRSLRLSDLARSANMTLSHLSRVIGRMERAGWVERVPDPHDGRSTLGRLTDAGWEKVEQAAPGHVRIVRELVFDALDPAQVRALGGATAVIARLVGPAGAGTAEGRIA
jgi:DNA-binding MarR family transcriptional regulator